MVTLKGKGVDERNWSVYLPHEDDCPELTFFLAGTSLMCESYMMGLTFTLIVYYHSSISHQPYCELLFNTGDNVIIGSYDRRLCWFDNDLSTKPYKTLR